MATLVSALFLTKEAAHEALVTLLDAGVSRDHISVAMSDATRTRHFGPSEVLEGADHANRAAAIGGVAGTILAGIATVGLFAAAGPLAAVLMAVSGGISGSLAGALIGAGMPEKHAHAVSKELEDGGILIGVDTDDVNRDRIQKLVPNCVLIFLTVLGHG